MLSLAIGRTLRMLRIRRAMRQEDVARRAGLSQSTIARHESGVIRSLHACERHAAVLDLRVEIRLRGLRADLARLTDEEHAAIVELLASGLQSDGWLTVLEASFNDRGERGRIDILAYHPAARLLVVIEVKTELADLQELFGSLNVKVAQSRSVARARSWPVDRVIPVIAVAATNRNRVVLRAHPASFRSWTQRSYRGAWPSAASGDSATLLWVPPAPSGRVGWLAGRRRVRRRPTAAPLPSGAVRARITPPAHTRERPTSREGVNIHQRQS